MASAKIKELTDETFAASVQGETPVLVDFWAEWCAPCRRIAPIVDELAEEYDGKLQVCKVDIDQHQQAANEHGVQSIPTLLIFKGGKVVERITGAVPKDHLVKAIQRAL